jgi:hypothetical protein
LTLSHDVERVLAWVFADPRAVELYQSHTLQMTASSTSRTRSRSSRGAGSMGRDASRGDGGAAVTRGHLFP